MTWLSDTCAIFIRNLIRMKRSPDIILFGILQPIMFVILFSQVFGGAIKVPGAEGDGAYTNYLMAGIFAQTAIFGATMSGSFMAMDRKNGINDRFKTLPIAPSSVLFARTFADVLLNTMSLIVMILTGLVVGWRPGGSILSSLGAVALIVAFMWGFSWVMIFLGLAVKSAEVFNNATFMLIFPLTFLSNAFVPAGSMPNAFFRNFAEWNPFSAFVQAIRELFGNTIPGPSSGVWPLEHAVPSVLIAVVLVTAIFMPLALRKFTKES